MRFVIAVAILTICPSAAFAQQSSKDALARLGIKIVEPMSAKELARTRSRVVGVLTRAGATSHFEDISNENGGQARHRPSGLVCPLGKRGQSVLEASAHSASCETASNGAVYRKNVERASTGASLDVVAVNAQANAQREPGYRPFPGLSVTGRPKAGSGKAEHRTLRYFSRASGRERAVRVQVGIVRGWVLTDRRETSKDAQPNNMAELLSEATFGVSMKQD